MSRDDPFCKRGLLSKNVRAQCPPRRPPACRRGSHPRTKTFGAPVPPLDAQPPIAATQDLFDISSAACAPPGVTSPNKNVRGPCSAPRRAASNRSNARSLQHLFGRLRAAGGHIPEQNRSGPLFRPSTPSLQSQQRKISSTSLR